LVVHRAITTVDRFNFLSMCLEVFLMKRNVLQLVLGLAAMAVVLVGLESQANAFGSHGSCGSHGGLFGGGSHGSSGSHGGLFHRHGGSCGETSCCEQKSCGCEEKSSCGCESSCNSCCGRHRHRGCCNSGCESSCGGESGCSACEAAKHESAAPAAPKEDKKEEKHEKSA
jgi:hypothetical protein